MKLLTRNVFSLIFGGRKICETQNYRLARGERETSSRESLSSPQLPEGDIWSLM